MKITIVNEKDEVIDSKYIDEIDVKLDIYRVSALWVTNSKNEILLARRAHTKKQNPGKWGPAAAGTIEEGETYESNIIKEAEEEIGLKDINPEKWVKTNTIGKPSISKYRHFTQWYKLKIDKPIGEFKIQKEEVSEVRWFSKEELEKMLRESPDQIVGSMKQIIGRNPKI